VSYWRALSAIVLVLAGAACGPSGEAVVPPSPDASGMEPQVVELFVATRAAVLERPGEAERWGRLGAAFDVHGLFAEAEACYRRARELDPDDFRWAYFLAIVRDVAGAGPDELIGAFRDAVALRSDYPQAHFRLGYALGLRGEVAEAEAAYRRAIELDPKLAMAQRDLGQLLLARGEVRQAVEVLLVAAELAPWDGAIFSTLAQAFERAGHAELAATAAARATRLEPANDIRDPELQYVSELGRSSMHWVARVRKQIDAEEFARAMESLEQLREIRPDDAHTFYLLGAVKTRLNQDDAALAALSRAVELDPDHLEARLEIARVLARRGSRPEALEHYRRARELAPSNTLVLLALAQALSESGDDAAATEIYLELEALGAHDARTSSNWGNALSRLGRDDEAVARFEAALTLDPRYANAHYNLALVLERLGRRADALAHYEEAVRIEPGHVAASSVERLRSADPS